MRFQDILLQTAISDNTRKRNFKYYVGENAVSGVHDTRDDFLNHLKTI